MNTPDNAPTNPTNRATLIGPGAPGFYGPFVVLEKLGEGGMGAVYLAQDTKLSRRVAIKTMRPELAADPDNRTRFEREARAAAAVEHESIVPILQVGEATDGTPFIVMPFLKGEPLDVRLKREPVSPLWLLLKVAREVTEGLAAAHAAGLIHRDIKPGNVWLEEVRNTERGTRSEERSPAALPTPQSAIRRVKVLDFGLARPVETDSAHLTASGAVMGTPAYMAPEQARAERVDHRADLFSLGAMLYRMATGQVPFRGANAVAVLIALTTEPPVPVREAAPGLPAALADLIERLMSKNPDGRPRSAADVLAALEQIDDTRPATPDPPAARVGATRPASPWEEKTEAETPAPVAPEAAPRRGRWVVAGLFVGLLALGALVLAVALSTGPGEGTLAVEFSGADAEARFKGGRLVLYGPDGKERYSVAPSDRTRTVDAGRYALKVEGADGVFLDASEVLVKRNGRAAVRVISTVPPAAAKVGDPNRLAAEYVLAHGGGVRIDGGNDFIDNKAHLPKGSFRLTAIALRKNEKNELVTDAGMAAFDGCAHLAYVDLYFVPVGDAGLKHLGRPGLTFLWLIGTNVTDAGMAHFKDCKQLGELNLSATKVTDRGLAHFQGCTEITGLHLSQMALTDQGVAHFKDCKKILNLNLAFTAVTDAGLEHFRGCTELTVLTLSGRGVTDAGLAHFKDCKSLTSAWLEGTAVGDATLTMLAECKQLTEVKVGGTRVTAEGAAALSKALPYCQIWWAGGRLGPIKN